MRLAPCAPPPGLRYHALVDAPVTSIASPMLEAVCAETGEAFREPQWCAYWDQSDDQGPYYLHECVTDAWYRVQLELPYTPSFDAPMAPTAERLAVLRLDAPIARPRHRVRLVGRVPRTGVSYSPAPRT